jgi:uncharacterized Zn finger protein
MGGWIIMTCPECGSEMYLLYFSGGLYDIIRCPKCGYVERLEVVNND